MTQLKAQDTIPPIIMLNNSEHTILVNVFDKYADTLEFLDNKSSKAYLKSQLVVGGTFYAAFKDSMATKLGDYNIVYSVKDSAGNVSDTVIRYLKVVDREAPKIFFIGNPLKIDSFNRHSIDHNKYIQKVTDNYCDTFEVALSVQDLLIDSINGLVHIVYCAIDSFENESCETLELVVSSWLNNVAVPNYRLSVFPNPSNGDFNVDAQGEITSIEIFTLAGQRLSGIQLLDAKVDLSHLQTGIYFLKITTEQGTGIAKVIKE
ncbi:MAG: T9SS type A sorting domain-containing protein [Bacteroidetes bacterium]|nr:T9SS type A sorting domain-containing protein [Bacteroidota bacterium]